MTGDLLARRLAALEGAGARVRVAPERPERAAREVTAIVTRAPAAREVAAIVARAPAARGEQR